MLAGMGLPSMGTTGGGGWASSFVHASREGICPHLPTSSRALRLAVTCLGAAAVHACHHVQAADVTGRLCLCRLSLSTNT